MLITEKKSDYWSNVKNEFWETGEALVSFYKEKKTLRWFSAILIFVFWAIKVVYEDVFIDSEIMLLEPYALLHSWYGSKRFGLILTKRLFHMIRLVPLLSNLLFVVALWNVVMLLCFCMERWVAEDKFKPYSMYLFSAAFITTPSLAEQYAFTLQSFEMTMAMIYCIIAAFCAGEVIYHRRSLVWYAVSVAFMVWAFASYQAFLPFYIALILMSFLCGYSKSPETHGIKCVLQHIALFLVGFIVYLVLAELLCRWQGGDSSYVEAMFVWQTLGVEECLRNIYVDFMILYGGWAPALFYKYFGICALLSAVTIIACGRKGKSRNFFWYAAAAVMFMLSPMYVTVVTGARTPIRAQLVFPLVIAFSFTVLWAGTGNLLMRKENGIRVKKCVCGLLLVFGLYQSWCQGMNLVQLSQTLHEAVTHDRMTANRMYADICQVADREDMQNCKVAFVGTRDARLPHSVTMGEAIGRSYFNFGITEIGVTNRVNALFNLLGMNMCPPTEEEYQKAAAACEGKESWPSRESVFYVDDVLVVKLSD